MSLPLTSTHRQNSTGHVFRVTNLEYADIYVNGLWHESTVPNIEILATKRNRYTTLLHTGVARVIANFYQWTLGSVYRIKKL